MLRFLSLLIVALASVALGQQQQQKTSGSPTNGSPLDLTAISATGGSSTFECWRLNATFKSPTGAQTGPVGVPLGNLSATSYSIIPAGFDGGLHNAPSRQYVGILPNGLDMTLTRQVCPLRFRPCPYHVAELHRQHLGQRRQERTHHRGRHGGRLQVRASDYRCWRRCCEPADATCSRPRL